VAGFDLKSYLACSKEKVDRVLLSLIPPEASYAKPLMEAMAYSLRAGGKRLRPILCLAGAAVVGGDPDPIIPDACALELLHTYSLIHDDLPAMDNDDLRRGHPTSHKKFGEACAVLAGDALLTLAFEILSRDSGDGGPSAPKRLKVIRRLAWATGCQGMVGGQMADIRAEGTSPDSETLMFIHTHKTAALISVSCEMGGILGGGTNEEVDDLKTYGFYLGHAFQIVDDILDVEGETGTLGKKAGKDREKGKATYPALLGIEGSRREAEILKNQALSALNDFGPQAEPLRALAEYLVVRPY
jgi:geranylgeranyl diphosphate synthase type II